MNKKMKRGLLIGAFAAAGIALKPEYTAHIGVLAVAAGIFVGTLSQERSQTDAPPKPKTSGPAPR